MTDCFEKAGIRFLYPENWSLTEDDLANSPLSVSVQSPGSAFWSLMVYDQEAQPRELIEQVFKSMQREYEEVEGALVFEAFGDVKAIGYDMCFYCLDFVVNSRVIATRALGRTLLILWQAEDREFEQLEPVFRAITASLLQKHHEPGSDRGHLSRSKYPAGDS